MHIQIKYIKLVNVFSFLVVLLFSGFATAQNKVVVIPMFGDDPIPIKNVVVVAKENGDFNNPVSAMNSIVDASVSNPYLVAIAPGEYNLGASQLVMKPFVEVTGSGKIATKFIAAIGSASDDSTAAVIVGANNSSLSNLSITNTRTNSNSFGIYNDAANIIIKNVSVSITDGSTTGFQVGILNDGTNAEISHVDVTLTGGGQQIAVFNRSASTASISNLIAEVNGGTSFQYGFLTTGTSPTTIKNSSLSVTNGSNRQWGINAGNASPVKVIDVQIEVLMGATNDQIGIELSVQPQDGQSVIYQSSINVEGGTDAYGIKLGQAGRAIISDVSSSASGGSGVNYGITISLLTEAVIRNSTLIGATNSILGSLSTAYISDSFLGGPRSVNGTFKCSFVHTTAGGALNGSCQ